MKQRINIKPLSVNRAWKGRRYRTDDYKNFQKEFMLKLKAQKISKDARLRIDYVFGFSSKLSDLDNPIKNTMDCLCKKFGFDDRQVFEMNVRKEIVERGSEFIEFSVMKLY